MTLTPQTYCMLCVVAWAAFALFFFRNDIFRKNRPATASETDAVATGTNGGNALDIIGQPKTVIDPTQTVPIPQTNSLKETEELDVEYEYDQADLDDLRTQTNNVPPVELDLEPISDIDLDTIDTQIAAMQAQTDEETQKLLTETASSFKQLSFAFDTAASPCRSIDDDRIAGETLKDISRTDMFYQAYRANMRRVDELLNSVSCKVVHLDNDELDVVAAKEEPTEDTWTDATENNEPQDDGSQNFIN